MKEQKNFKLAGKMRLNPDQHHRIPFQHFWGHEEPSHSHDIFYPQRQERLKQVDKKGQKHLDN